MSRVVDLVAAQLRPTPWSELGALRRARRCFGALMFLSALAMGAAASTSYTDWDITSEDVDKQFG